MKVCTGEYYSTFWWAYDIYLFIGYFMTTDQKVSGLNPDEVTRASQKCEAFFIIRGTRLFFELLILICGNEINLVIQVNFFCFYQLLAGKFYKKLTSYLCFRNFLFLDLQTICKQTGVKTSL